MGLSTAQGREQFYCFTRIPKGMYLRNALISKYTVGRPLFFYYIVFLFYFYMAPAVSSSSEILEGKGKRAERPL